MPKNALQHKGHEFRQTLIFYNFQKNDFCWFNYFFSSKKRSMLPHSTVLTVIVENLKNCAALQAAILKSCRVDIIPSNLAV